MNEIAYFTHTMVSVFWYFITVRSHGRQKIYEMDGHSHFEYLEYED